MTRARFAAADDALAAVDPTLAARIDALGPCRFGPKPAVEERFAALVHSIIAQQLGGPAARTIQGRVVNAVGGTLAPEAFLQAPIDELRAAGLSGAKTAALLDLAAHVSDGRLDLAHLGRLDDAEVVEALTVVRGIGPWTAHMFTIFALHRLDVWPTGDLGVRAGFAVIFGVPVPHAAALEPLGERFRPYRSVLAWYCWQALDAGRAKTIA